MDEDAVVDECILADGVHVPRGARWRRRAVVRAGARTPQGDEQIEGDLLLAPIPDAPSR